jgi:NADH:ubiquinone reductase (H+-translocating)
MAVVSKNFAILESGRFHMSGFLTWLVWVFLHLMSLPQLQNSGFGRISPDSAARD